MGPAFGVVKLRAAEERGRRKKAKTRLGFGAAEAWCRKAPYLANIDAIDFAVPIRRTALPS